MTTVYSIFSRNALKAFCTFVLLMVSGCVPYPAEMSPMPDSAGQSEMAVTSQQPPVAPEAAQWGTWVLESSDALRPDAPPDEEATQDEIAQLKELMAQNDDATQAMVAYWNAGSPTYRWVQVTNDRHKTLPPGPSYTRAMSMLTVAMYDGLIAAWDAKYTYNRPRPSAFDDSMTTLVEAPNSPSYPSERAVVAGTASTVLAYLFPDEAEQYMAMAEEAAQSQLVAGIQYPSDVEVGLELGRMVGEKLVERAKNDGSDAVWDGERLEGPGYFTWRGDGPAIPASGTWQTWLLSSNDQLRPPPPPAYDSPERAAEITEIKAFTRTFATNASAFFWQSHPGVKTYWYDVADRLLFETELDQNPPYAALVYSTLSISSYDAFIACFEAKYAYWAMRPSQVDPEIITPFPHPNHPSYPAAHGCFSGNGATLMSTFFPEDSEWMIAAGREAVDSRFWAGIHYPSDNEAGWGMGQEIAQIATERVKEMMER